MIVPVHMFIALGIEAWAATQAMNLKEQLKGKLRGKSPYGRKHYWRAIRFCHILNFGTCLSITSIAVYTNIYHPLLGMICEMHAVIVALKLMSYALTNRDLRDAYLESHPIPAIYARLPYPKNIKILNLLYFWWAPTLIYQPLYPRSPSIRYTFLVKRTGETIVIIFGLWFVTSQYAR